MAQRRSVSTKTSLESASTVVVGCKIPQGLLLQLCKPYVERELKMGGGSQDVTVYRRFGPRVRINGNVVNRAAPREFRDHVALTRNVDAKFMRAWMEQNKEHPSVVNGLIFIAAAESDVRAQGYDLRNEKTGLEPINPDSDDKGRPLDKRLPSPKRITGANGATSMVGGITQGDDQYEGA